MFPWKMWTRFWPATESGVGAVSRCLPAPKLCVLSFDMRLSADGVGPASPPGLMARGCSSTKDSLSDRKSTRLNSSHRCISYAVFCLKKEKQHVVPPAAACARDLLVRHQAPRYR